MAIVNKYNVEFDDSLLDYDGWKKPRYEGSKLTGQKINEFNAGDITYGKNAVITNKVTALYIGSTLIDGQEEDEALVFIKGHSYINIDKVLIINPDTDDVNIVESKAENDTAFRKFITSNLKTGTKFNIDLLDLSIQNKLERNHTIRMNKGLLLKSFKYVPVPPDLDREFEITNNESLLDSGTNQLLEGLSLHKTNAFGFRANISFESASNARSDADQSGSVVPQGPLQLGHNNPHNFFFRYRTFLFKDTDGNDFLNSGDSGTNINTSYTIRDIVPNYVSSSYHENKFTLQYVEEFTYNFIGDKLSFDNDFGTGVASTAHPFSRGGLSKFFSASCVFAKENNHEMYLTINQGTIDMAPEIGDERSMTTFEIETRMPTPLAGTSSLTIADGGDGSGDLVLGIETRNNFGVFDGLQDAQLMLKNNFLPTLPTFPDIQNSLILQGSSTVSGPILTEDRDVFLRGNSGITGSVTSYAAIYGAKIAGTSELSSQHQQYSGSFDYEVSFLDPAPVVIADINKEKELFDGIGEKGFVIIPQQTNQKIKDNLEFYLEKAGLIEKTTTTLSPKKGI